MSASLGPREWLALSMVPGLGCLRIKRLYREGLAWPDGWYPHLSLEQRHYLRYLLTDSIAHAQLQPALHWHQPRLARHVLFPGHEAWPELLNEIDDPPVILWAWGDLSALEKPKMAIVGSRKASQQGQSRAHAFSSRLASSGISVISGMAMGIDTAAHQGALSSNGSTIAVLGCGIDVLYPRQNAWLRKSILENRGLILSEFSPGIPARSCYFPRRNRIITGLSLGILVIEATMRSGSLLSARLALEQNREVFALPGTPEDQQMSGCLWLIQQGAMLVTCVDDMLQTLSIPAQDSPDSLATSRIALHPLMQYMSAAPCSLDYLVDTSQSSLSQCLTELQQLELDGCIKRVPGGWVKATHD